MVGMARYLKCIPRSWRSGTKRRSVVLMLATLALLGIFAYHKPSIGEPQDRLPRGRVRSPKTIVEMDSGHRDIDTKVQVINTNKSTLEVFETTTSTSGGIYFKELLGKSCHNYAEEPPKAYGLEDAKKACIMNENCNAIECDSHNHQQCTLRMMTDGVDYPPADCYVKVDPQNKLAEVHPEYHNLLKEYPFQMVTTQSGKPVNIIVVRSPFGASGPAKRERELYEKYKDEILFLGISSFEDYPLDAMNPYSPRLDVDYFLGAFPGFLHMMHHPEAHFPPHVKTILMSQSDFDLPNPNPNMLDVPKEYDFTYAATWPLGPVPNTECIGWSGYCKNWSFAKQSLDVLCGEYNLKGVLVATQDKSGSPKCEIPASCEGKITQTSYINQDVYFDYLKKSRFAYVPQVHDASPRVSTQALIHNVPLLMNAYISGGWKYITEETGEFFHDMTDFRDSLDRILRKGREGKYQPRKWVLEHYGNEHSGERLLKFVMDNFGDRVHLPAHTKRLLI